MGLGGQISPQYHDLFAPNSSINGPDSGGSKVPPVAPTDRDPTRPRTPADARPIHVNGIRSEPGSTRLS